MLGLGRRDHRLAARADELGEARAARRVELRHHVVEQHQRRALALDQRVALGEQERQQANALLALRAERAQRPVAVDQREVVAVRPVLGEAALEVGLAALAQLLDEPVRVVGRERGW